jgi:hypothetical protein
MSQDNQPVDERNISPTRVLAYRILNPRAAFWTVRVTRLMYFIFSESKQCRNNQWINKDYSNLEYCTFLLHCCFFFLSIWLFRNTKSSFQVNSIFRAKVQKIVAELLKFIASSRQKKKVTYTTLHSTEKNRFSFVWKLHCRRPLFTARVSNILK